RHLEQTVGEIVPNATLYSCNVDSTHALARILPPVHASNRARPCELRSGSSSRGGNCRSTLGHAGLSLAIRRTPCRAVRPRMLHAVLWYGATIRRLSIAAHRCAGFPLAHYGNATSSRSDQHRGNNRSGGVSQVSLCSPAYLVMAGV